MNDEVQKVCPVVGCGIAYCLPARFDAERREDHASWYCPNGHALSYPRGASAKERRIRELVERVAWLERELEQSRGYHRRRLAELEHEVRSLRGRLSWARRRAA